MDILNINKILNRETIVNHIKDILLNFETSKNDQTFKKGIYIYGSPGSGKTTFITNLLKELNYDVIRYDAGDIRNTGVIEELTQNNMANKNIISIFHKKVKKIAIIMDEIDGMNSGDKGGINALIKLIRPKKTKKQKLEETTSNPIICIGNYYIDKKIKELMKVCNVIELQTPNNEQIGNIVKILLPSIDNEFKKIITEFIQGDLRKLNNIIKMYKSNQTFFSGDLIQNLFQLKSYNDDTKKITEKLFDNKYTIEQHINIMNDSDRTSVGLLWHENIIDAIEKINKNKSIPFYIEQLENICFSDYIDRITFQKQIWQFKEMSSLVKTMKNNKLYHEFKEPKKPLKEIRFTKVLTKYSTEYNNSLFIQKLCQKLNIDKKDLFGLFIKLKNERDEAEIISILENYEISKLDINRIYRYIDKYLKENATGTNDKEIDIEDDYDDENVEE